MRRLLLLASLLGLAVAAVAAWRFLPNPAPAAEGAPGVALVDAGVPVTGLPADPGDRPVPPPAATVTIHVVGPVAHPGVVVLPAGSRVADAVAASGGFVPGAPADGVNLARRLVDGEHLDVGAPAPGADPPAPGAASSGPAKVDLNTATSQQLQELPGVGPVLADRIVAYRQQHGGFDSVGQLQEVAGIGASRLADLEPLVQAGPG